MSLNFFNGTTEVNVDDIGLRRLNNLNRAKHRFFVCTKNLNPNRAFFFVYIKLHDAFGSVSNQTLARNEFGVYYVSPMFLAQGSKRRVAYVFHGCKKKRKVTEFDVTNFYQSVKFFTKVRKTSVFSIP